MYRIDEGAQHSSNNISKSDNRFHQTQEGKFVRQDQVSGDHRQLDSQQGMDGGLAGGRGDGVHGHVGGRAIGMYG